MPRQEGKDIQRGEAGLWCELLGDLEETGSMLPVLARSAADISITEGRNLGVISISFFYFFTNMTLNERH